jgi:hypothetical protein
VYTKLKDTTRWDTKGMYFTFPAFFLSDEERQEWGDLGTNFREFETESGSFIRFTPCWEEPEVFEFQAMRDVYLFYCKDPGKCADNSITNSI